MKNRLMAILLIICMLLTVSACAKKSDGEEADVDDGGGYTVDAEQTVEVAPEEEERSGAGESRDGSAGKAPAQASDNGGAETAGDKGAKADGKAAEEETANVVETASPSENDPEAQYDSRETSFKTAVTNDNGWIPDTEHAGGAGGAEDPTLWDDGYQNGAVPGTLTAGEWNDNDNYEDYLKVLAENEWFESKEGWRMNLRKRLAVTVTSHGEPCKNLKIEIFSGKILLYSTFTDYAGNAYLYYNKWFEKTTPTKVVVDEDISYTVSDEELKSGKKLIEYGGSHDYYKLDIMFTTDTTASMSDELKYLQSEFKDVIAKVSKNNKDLNIRMSVNFYRDENDQYVLRSFPFDSDVEKVQKQLAAQSAAGGGDYPEALDEALMDSVSGHEWREDSIKLLFLTLDAPAHKNLSTIEIIRSCISTAAEKGIRVIPIMCSGTGLEAELLLRAIAAQTGGTYVFLTDDSGVGNEHLKPSVGEFTVKPLNELIVEIVNRYCK